MSKKSKSKAKLSVQEFQTWLQGIMEFQDNDWSPNAEQWNAIYEKIMNLKAESTVMNISAQGLRDVREIVQEELYDNLQRGGPPENFNQGHPQQQPHPQQQKPGLFDEEPDPNQQLNPNMQAPIITEAEMQSMTKEEFEEKLRQAKEFGTKMMGSIEGSGASTIKTPDVDTSSGGYNSNFT
jgi:hypothetical protein